MSNGCDGPTYHHPHRENLISITFFFTTESPLINARILSHHRLDLYPDFFNLTLTYGRDSNVQYPYGKFYPNPSSKTTKTEPNRHRKLVAWAATHCRTLSGRERFVKYLNFDIPVDIYGQCGSLGMRENVERQTRFLKNFLVEPIKFYLAFENSFCREYVSEKFYITGWRFP